MTIRILLIDDHTLFRSGVHALLQRQPDLPPAQYIHQPIQVPVRFITYG